MTHLGPGFVVVGSPEWRRADIHDFRDWAGENVMLMVRALSLLMGLMIVVWIQEACAEPETLTLSCDGTLTNMMSTSDSDNKTEAFTKMGLLVNLAEGTALGFIP